MKKSLLELTAFNQNKLISSAWKSIADRYENNCYRLEKVSIILNMLQDSPLSKYKPAKAQFAIYEYDNFTAIIVSVYQIPLEMVIDFYCPKIFQMFKSPWSLETGADSLTLKTSLGSYYHKTQIDISICIYEITDFCEIIKLTKLKPPEPRYYPEVYHVLNCVE